VPWRPWISFSPSYQDDEGATPGAWVSSTVALAKSWVSSEGICQDTRARLRRARAAQPLEARVAAVISEHDLLARFETVNRALLLFPWVR
jgi:hypothetical protein